jgi:hypothetical protein
MGDRDEKTILDGRMRERYLFSYYAYCFHGRQDVSFPWANVFNLPAYERRFWWLTSRLYHVRKIAEHRGTR